MHLTTSRNALVLGNHKLLPVEVDTSFEFVVLGFQSEFSKLRLWRFHLYQGGFEWSVQVFSAMVKNCLLLLLPAFRFGSVDSLLSSISFRLLTGEGILHVNFSRNIVAAPVLVAMLRVVGTRCCWRLAAESSLGYRQPENDLGLRGENRWDRKT